MKSNQYEGIIGINSLKSFQAVIDTDNNQLQIFKKFIVPFANYEIPDEILEAFHLEPIESAYKEIENKISTDAKLNSEEFKFLKSF